MPTLFTITQDAAELNLEWVQGDPVSLTFLVKDGQAWAGNYECQVRVAQDSESTKLADLAVTCVSEPYTTDCRFTLTLSSAVSETIPATGPNAANGHYFDIQQVGGVTRFRGRVIVIADVTVPT